MKTLALAWNKQDKSWLQSLVASSRPGDQVIVVASPLGGRMIAAEAGIPYISYEEEAWKIDRCELIDIAMNKSCYWHEIDEIRNLPLLRAISHFKEYPLFHMHQSRLLLAVYEILQAYEFVHQILARERPENIAVGVQANPFYEDTLHYVASENGVEPHVIKSIMAQRENRAMETACYPDNVEIKRPLASQQAVGWNELAWKTSCSGPKILIYTWGGYYVEYLDTCIEFLESNNASIIIVLIGGSVDVEHAELWKSKDIKCIDKSAAILPHEQQIWSTWVERCRKATSCIYANPTLKSYFSDKRGSYYPGLVEVAISKQIMDMPCTVIELLRAEAVTRRLQPDIVLNHFAVHPEEACDVLPVRMLGIPTIEVLHGVDGYTSALRATSAAEYITTASKSFRNSLLWAVEAPPDKVVAIGNPRFDRYFNNIHRTSRKKPMILPEGGPVCVFCDNSGFSHAHEWRYSTARTCREILQLRRHIPGLRIIYRGHHGTSQENLKAYIESLGSENVYIQLSLDISLLDILSMADIVIAHYSSATSEALTMGVPVVYLTAVAQREYDYYNCEAIWVVEDFDRLSVVVKEILDMHLSREEVRCRAKRYFDRALAGNDGKAGQRLGELALQLAARPKAERPTGFQDWIARIHALCKFESRALFDIKELERKYGT